MKKTLVAVAAMAAVTGAMADVTLSGNIDQAWLTTKLNSTSKTTDIQGSGYGNGGLGDTFLTMAGSEDLGGGMKASFKMEPRLDPNAAAHTMTNRESWVGISGGFGAVQIGTTYSPMFNLVSAGTDVGGVSNMIGSNYVTGGTASIGQGNSSINYTLPSLATGLTAQLGIIKGGANSVSTTGAGAGDGQGFALNYATGGLTIGYGSQSNKNTKLAVFSPTQIAGGGATSTTLAAAAAGTSMKQTATGLTYDLGVAKLTYLSAKAALSGDSVKTDQYGISVPFGATTLAYMSGTQSANDSGTVSKQKSSQLQAKYSLSKRTTAYFATGSLSTSTGTADKMTQQAIGLAHSF
ncbi:MAG: porin [Betaproteobacteria bacterium]|nr:porin [Betaproteobacteria bacterium]